MQLKFTVYVSSELCCLSTVILSALHVAGSLVCTFYLNALPTAS